MTRSSRFQPDRLYLARTFHGHTQTELAERIGFSPGALSQFETSARQPSDDAIEALSEVLLFRPEFFFEPIADQFKEDECNFRHRASAPAKIKAHVLSQGSLLAMLVAYLRENIDLPDYDVPRMAFDSLQDIEAAAGATRTHWGLPLDAPIGNFPRIIGDAGVIVIEQRASTEKIDAFSRYGPVSVIVLNPETNSTSRVRLNIGHEIGHLVGHIGIKTGDRVTERQADHFGGAFLLPGRAFARHFRTAQEVDWDFLFELKAQWGASLAAILYRARQLDLLGAAAYLRAMKSMSARGWRKQEPQEPDHQPPEMLKGALVFHESEHGETPHQVARALHWTPKVFESLTGVSADPPNDLGNLVNLREFRAS